MDLDVYHQISELIYKERVGIATKEEIKKLEAWKLESKANTALYNRTNELHRIQSSFEVYEQIDPEQAFHKIIPPKQNKVRMAPHWWKKYSAAAILVIGLSYILYLTGNLLLGTKEQVAQQQPQTMLITSDGEEFSLNDSSLHEIQIGDAKLVNKNNTIAYPKHQPNTGLDEINYHTIMVPRGGGYQLTLSDGTKVWLNSGTQLKYPVSFVEDIRKVTLTGEAYFDVAHDKDKPFVVMAQGLEMTVLGTEFNSKAYPEEQQVTTTLVEGKVSVKGTGNAARTLAPGQQALFTKADNNIGIKEVDITSAISWMKGRFVFRGESLQHIMNDIARWYDVDIIYDDGVDKGLRFNMNVSRNEDLKKVLNAITKTGKIKIMKKQRTIYVTN